MSSDSTGHRCAFKKREAEPQIFHLSFTSHRVMVDTFLRFQEHYESPRFRGRIFTRREFREWYKTTTPSGKFTYYTDWAGFNIPDYILKPFYEGQFKNQSPREKDLLDTFKKMAGRFYVIGSMQGELRTFKHELAHGRFYINDGYRHEVLAALTAHDTAPLRRWLFKIGYDELTVADEIHAYLLTGTESLPQSIDRAPFIPLTRELKRIECRYFGPALKA